MQTRAGFFIPRGGMAGHREVEGSGKAPARESVLTRASAALKRAAWRHSYAVVASGTRDPSGARHEKHGRIRGKSSHLRRMFDFHGSTGRAIDLPGK